MLSCKMRLAMMAVIVCYSVSFQRIAATVLYLNELTGDRIALFDSNGLTDAIGWRFPFLGRIRNSLKISKDGFIVFNSDTAAEPAVTVNVLRTTLTLGSGSYVWRRLTNDTATLSQVTQDIQPYFSVVGSYTFNAKWALLVTWYKMNPAENTFQLVLATDGVASFAMLNYENIASSLGTVKFGFTSPGTVLSIYSGQSGSSHALLMKRTNVGVAGRWLVRVDGRGVLEPDCAGFSISTESRINMQAPFGVENVPTGCTSTNTYAALPSKTFATSFMLVPCNAEVIGSEPRFPGMPCVSIAPVFAPDTFVRHSYGSIYLCSQLPADTNFAQDSSFIMLPNSFKNGFFALHSYNYPTVYIQFQPTTVTQTVPANPMTADYSNSASFTLGILPSCPYGDKATWCSTIKINLCSQAPFDLLCRATCDALTATTQPTTTTTGVGVLKLTKCARPAYRIANPEFCKNWFPFNRRPFPARRSNWAGPRAAPWAGRGAGRRFW